MEIFFSDPHEAPLPPNEVRIKGLAAEPYPDGRRVRITLSITAFQQRPDAELTIRDPQGAGVASVSVIETIDPRMEMTMHIPKSAPSGEYTLEAQVFYRPAESDGLAPPESEPGITLPAAEVPVQVVDRAQVQFTISPKSAPQEP